MVSFRSSLNLFRQEILVIVPTGLLLNYAGLAIAIQLKTILYLDMSGTAFVSFLLGPWWGATTGLLPNSIVNLALNPDLKPENVFPWSLVNITGGIVWGRMAQRAAFREYLISSRNSLRDDIKYLITFGVVAAGAMSVVGTMVKAAVGDENILAQDFNFAHAVNAFLDGWRPTLQRILGPMLSPIIPDYLETWFQYIPDKTMSAAFALAALRVGFPLFDRELILRSQHGDYNQDNWTGPVILMTIYVPSYVRLIGSEDYQRGTYAWLWSLPLVVAIIGAWRVRQILLTPADVADRERRLECYTQSLGALDATNRFFSRFKYAVIISSIVFVMGATIILMVGLPGNEVELFRVAFNYLGGVYVGLLAIHLGRISICQNIARAATVETDPTRQIAINEDGAREAAERIDLLDDG